MIIARARVWMLLGKKECNEEETAAGGRSGGKRWGRLGLVVKNVKLQQQNH